MKINAATFRASAKGLEDCPPSNLPEFAFIGRSNVGKSSLINMLTERKELAHTSGKPGKTQRINLFTVNESWTLVDLPGYGYAKLSKLKQEEFNRDISEYLTKRKNLKHVFLLVDSQLEPQGGDLSFAAWLQDCGISYSIILTKTDRGSENKLSSHSGLFIAELEAYDLKPSNVYACSAKTKQGRGPILQWIDQQLPKKPKKKQGKPVNLNWMK